MASFPCYRIRFVVSAAFAFVAAPMILVGQTFVPQGGEYSVAGALPGDQANPQVSIKPSGGMIVWDDNLTDGDGLGVSARRLDSSLSGTLSTFRVNVTGAFDQSSPAVAMLNDGGSVFVWEGGKPSFQHIYARFMNSAGLFQTTSDVMVNTTTNKYQSAPTVVTLAGGDVIVIWSSIDQESAGSMQGIYGQRFTSDGTKIGGEFLINQFTSNNQRDASIAALSSGGFAVVWVSELQASSDSVDVRGRLYTATATPVAGEFLVSNSGTNICSNPSVAGASDGTFSVAWGEYQLIGQGSTEINTNSWDVYVRNFSSSGTGGSVSRLNATRFGDQLKPRISASQTDYLAVWTSFGQDGSREGVYGRYVSASGGVLGSEFRVNTVTTSQQIHPTIGGDATGRFLVSWAGFSSLADGFDLKAQRFVNTNALLSAPGAPHVSVLSSSSLAVSWPVVQGMSVSNYEVYADGSVSPTVAVTNTYWNATGLAASSQHSYRLAFVLTDGRRSPLSESTTNATYSTVSYFGIPGEWMSYYFGEDWPLSTADNDGDGVSNKNEFLAGTDPTDANSVLKIRMEASPLGPFLSWNTQPGLIYQVQSATLAGGAWLNVGGPRFAPSFVDSIYVGGANTAVYRIQRLR